MRPEAPRLPEGFEYRSTVRTGVHAVGVGRQGYDVVRSRDGVPVGYVYMAETEDVLDSIPGRPHRLGWFAECNKVLEHPTRGHAARYAIEWSEHHSLDTYISDMEPVPACSAIAFYAPTSTYEGEPRMLQRGADPHKLVILCAREVARAGVVVVARVVQDGGHVLYELDGKDMTARGPLSTSGVPVDPDSRPWHLDERPQNNTEPDPPERRQLSLF